MVAGAALSPRVRSAAAAARRSLFASAAILAAAAPGIAQDRTLSRDFPLQLDDAFPTATGEAAARASVRAVRPQHGADHAEGPTTLEVSIAPRTQLSVSAQWSSEPALTHAGDATIAGRYQFWVQEDALPNLAAQLAITAPTGVGSRAWTFEAKGLATRAVDTNLYVHLNAAAVVVDRLEEQARRLRYRLALGPSWIVPSMATVLVAGDVYAEQGIRRDEATTVGLEIGFRHRIGGGVDWHGAVGTEVAGAATRAALTVTTGLSFGFTLLGR